MLLQFPENNLAGVSKYKNEYWEKKGITPNEAYFYGENQDSQYKKLVENFVRMHNLGRPIRFYEVRVLSAKTQLTASLREKWWDDPMFMDRVFWCFQKPVYETVDNQHYGYYALEPMECLRVINVGWKKFGRQPVSKLTSCFVIPIECCQLAWNETSNGFSDHLHVRPEVVLTQEQIDAVANKKREVEKVLSKAVDINKDPMWKSTLTQVEKRLTDESRADSKGATV